jgi:hypothetical protein
VVLIKPVVDLAIKYQMQCKRYRDSITSMSRCTSSTAIPVSDSRHKLAWYIQWVTTVPALYPNRQHHHRRLYIRRVP